MTSNKFKHSYDIKIIILTFFLLIVVNPNDLIAHPLDISFTTLTPRNYGLYCETYIHPYEIDLLLSSHGKKLLKSNHKQIAQYLIPYFKKHFKVYQLGKQLSLYKVHFKEKNLSEILANGVYLIYKIPSGDQKPIFQFKISLFIEYFSTQTNKIIMLNSKGKHVDNPEVVLTKNKQTWLCNVDFPDFSEHFDDGKDSDKDGLTDHMEKNYGFNPLKKDTDGDGYDDFTEFSMGYDPNNRNNHP